MAIADQGHAPHAASTFESPGVIFPESIIYHHLIANLNFERFDMSSVGFSSIPCQVSF